MLRLLVFNIQQGIKAGLVSVGFGFLIWCGFFGFFFECILAIWILCIIRINKMQLQQLLLCGCCPNVKLFFLFALNRDSPLLLPCDEN